MSSKNAHRPMTILRRPEVEKRTGLSRSTIYRRIEQGTFPAPVLLGIRAVGWIEAEIDLFLADCVASRNCRAPQYAGGFNERNRGAI